MPNSAFNDIEEYLGELNDVRLEWSLEVSKDVLIQRKKPVFWVGMPESNSNEESFKKFNLLLIKMNCPEKFINEQQESLPKIFSMGFRIELDDTLKRKGFFIQTLEKAPEKVKYKYFGWGQDIELNTALYDFNLFSEVIDKEELSQLIHPSLKDTFNSLISNKQLIQSAGLSKQFKKDILTELYLTCPWHPQISYILSDLMGFLSEPVLHELISYKESHFRHIGITSALSGRAAITFYFSAPLLGKWPKNFSELQNEIKTSGAILHEQLTLMLKKRTLN